jgi:SAM-dependent methyltransferase
VRPGDAVLDICCGSGASAIPAAHAVFPEGSVLGVDLSESLLELASAKVERCGLHNVEFRAGDFETLPLPVGGFDAVLCVFGIFFFPDMTAMLRRMWRLLRPGGRLAVTTWGNDLFEPASTVFWDAVRRERPDLYKGFNPWDTLTEPSQLRRLFSAAGVELEEVRIERRDHEIERPEDWWTIVMGSGYRGTVEQLEPDARERVRRHCEDYLWRTGVRTLRLSAIYALAHKA